MRGRALGCQKWLKYQLEPGPYRCLLEANRIKSSREILESEKVEILSGAFSSSFVAKVLGRLQPYANSCWEIFHPNQGCAQDVHRFLVKDIAPESTAWQITLIGLFPGSWWILLVNALSLLEAYPLNIHMYWILGCHDERENCYFTLLY